MCVSACELSAAAGPVGAQEMVKTPGVQHILDLFTARRMSRPCLCLFIMLSTDGFVALNKTVAQVAEDAGLRRYLGIHSPRTHSCCTPRAIVPGHRGAPKARLRQLLSRAEQFTT